MVRMALAGRRTIARWTSPACIDPPALVIGAILVVVGLTLLVAQLADVGLGCRWSSSGSAWWSWRAGSCGAGRQWSSAVLTAGSWRRHRTPPRRTWRCGIARADAFGLRFAPVDDTATHEVRICVSLVRACRTCG